MKGVCSKIFHCPADSSNRKRDLFPLPNLRDEPVMQRDVCRAVRQRIQKRGFVTKRVNLAIDSLNSLFYGGGKRC